jgi:hypothetical protein
MLKKEGVLHVVEHFVMQFSNNFSPHLVFLALPSTKARNSV